MIDQHKHCIFCGEVISNLPLTSECKSEYNTITPDTSGKRYHGYLGLLLKPDEKMCGQDAEREAKERTAQPAAGEELRKEKP